MSVERSPVPPVLHRGTCSACGSVAVGMKLPKITSMPPHANVAIRAKADLDVTWHPSGLTRHG